MANRCPDRPARKASNLSRADSASSADTAEAATGGLTNGEGMRAVTRGQSSHAPAATVPRASSMARRKVLPELLDMGHRAGAQETGTVTGRVTAWTPSIAWSTSSSVEHQPTEKRSAPVSSVPRIR